MINYLIKPHSFIDLITNSSTELFIVSTAKSVFTIQEMLRDLCVSEDDKEWYYGDLRVTQEGEDVRIFSFLNSPDWFVDFIESNFTIISYD